MAVFEHDSTKEKQKEGKHCIGTLFVGTWAKEKDLLKNKALLFARTIGGTKNQYLRLREMPR